MLPAGPQKLKESKGEKEVRKKYSHVEDNGIQPRWVEILKEDGTQGYHQADQAQKGYRYFPRGKLKYPAEDSHPSDQEPWHRPSRAAPGAKVSEEKGEKQSDDEEKFGELFHKSS
jgi:hypothetical protein